MVDTNKPESTVLLSESLITEVDAHREGGRYVLALGYHMKIGLSYGLASQIVRCLQKALNEK